VLVALGGAAGAVLGRYILRFVLRQLTALPLVLPHLQVAALDGRVLLFNLALCALLAILCSLAPIALSSRTDIQGVLRGGRTVAGPKGSIRLFSLLIASEAAFAMILLVGSGLMTRSLIHLQKAEHGLRPDHVLTLRVPVGGGPNQVGAAARYNTKPRQIAYYSEILDRIQRIPGVQEAAIVNNLPLSGVSSTTIHRDFSGEVIGISTRTITPRYFAAMGIPLIAGRLFTDADQAGSPGVVIVNQHLARQFFPDRSPIGQRIPSESGGPGATVVGVVKDTPQLVYGKPAENEVYIPMRQYIFAAFMSTIVVRTPGDPLAVAATIQKEVWAVDSNQPVLKIETMNDVIAESIWRPRFSAWIFSVLGGLAVLLTAAGVYAVIAYTSKLRAHEIGIRVALGATPRHVVRNVLQSAMIPLSAGLAFGLAAALLLSRLLSKLLYGVSTNDAATYLAATGFLLLIGAIASARPAWKAAAGDPLEAIRSE
jgi:predicted permease